MRFGIKTLDDFELKGKTVLCRIDINQPVDKATGKLKSINRIRACVPTIRELSEKGARVVPSGFCDFDGDHSLPQLSHLSCLPPIRCRWRWWTLWPASSPTLVMSR